MENSILKSTKQALGLEADYTPFDQELIMHINSVFSTLVQLGIGPATGFAIADDTTEWSSLLAADANLNSVKTYVFLKVRMIFDPPATSYAITAMEKQIEEFEWRLNVYRESTQWTDPLPPPTPDYYDPFADPVVIDGSV